MFTHLFNRNRPPKQTTRRRKLDPQPRMRWHR